MLTTTLTKDYTDKPHEHVPCPLCSADNDYLLATRGYPGIPVRNVICTGCGLIRIDPRMTAEGYEAFYREDFFEYLNPYGRPAYVETIDHTTDDTFETPFERNVLPYLLTFVKEGGKMLDVGAGFGQVLYLLKKHKHVTGIGMEPDPYSRQLAKEKVGIDLLDMTIEDFLATNTDTFDFIHLDQVFEHLLKPLDTLRDLGSRLTTEGVIYIGVPNSYNPGVHMDRYYELAHTYGYTPATMKRFADQAGLKVISVRDPYGAALEVVLARKDSTHPEEKQERLIQGSSWKDTVRRLRRKERLNKVRGFAKKLLVSIGGETLKERIRSGIDRLIKYRY